MTRSCNELPTTESLEHSSIMLGRGTHTHGLALYRIGPPCVTRDFLLLHD